MKPFIISLLMLASPRVYGQIDSFLVHLSPTTLDEYNYMTKGYRIQVESGLDMKKGYLWKDIGEHNIENYNFKIKNLIREHQQELVGVLIITYSITSGRTYYTGIPIQNPELMKLHTAEIAKWDRGITAAYLYLLSSYLTVHFNSLHMAQ
jgi:hypothetical protein